MIHNIRNDLGNRDGNQTLRDDPGASGVNFVVDGDTNRYMSIGGNSISHDDAGNLTADKDGYAYEYDYENRIVKIQDSSSNDVVEYAYNALGRRIRVIDSKASTTTLYYYNPVLSQRLRWCWNLMFIWTKLLWLT